MTNKLYGALVVLTALLFPTYLANAQPAFPPAITAEVKQAPVPVPMMGKLFLVYELTLSNFLPLDVELTSVEVFADDSDKPTFSAAGESLHTLLLKPGGQAVAPGVLRAGAFDVVYLMLELEKHRQPASLRHRVSISAMGQNASIDAISPVTRASTIPELGPPLRGGPWVMAHGLVNTSGHRQIYVPLDGKPYLPQRYSIDYHKVDENFSIFNGDRSVREDHYAYGEDVLAVADGLVVDVKEGIPENTVSDTERAVPITLDTVGGNYVMLDIGNDMYGFYAHLQPGSITVKKGDRVKKGQVLGLLGLSGNTPAPHLHFNLGRQPSGLGNDSLPYVFDRFDVVGECDAGPEHWAWYTVCQRNAPQTRNGELPGAWKLVRFAD